MYSLLPAMLLRGIIQPEAYALQLVLCSTYPQCMQQKELSGQSTLKMDNNVIAYLANTLSLHTNRQRAGSADCIH
jgi:hypothetical protein